VPQTTQAVRRSGAMTPQPGQMRFVGPMAGWRPGAALVIVG
jgi:hypothetical protein